MNGHGNDPTPADIAYNEVFRLSQHLTLMETRLRKLEDWQSRMLGPVVAEIRAMSDDELITFVAEEMARRDKRLIVPADKEKNV